MIEGWNDCWLTGLLDWLCDDEKENDRWRPTLLSYIQLSSRTVHTRCLYQLHQQPLGPRQEHSTRHPHGQRHAFNSKECECQAFAFQRRISSSVRDLGDKCTTEVLSVSKVRTDRIPKTRDRPQVSWTVLEPPLRDGSPDLGDDPESGVSK